MENSMIIIFGATGDLAKRKLIPGIYKLFNKKMISDIPIICVGRKDFQQEEYLNYLNIDEYASKDSHNFKKKIIYHRVDFSNDFLDFKKFTDKIDEDYACMNNVLFYFATSSHLFGDLSMKLQAAGMLEGKGWKRIIFEKPFGHDLESAKKLNDTLKTFFDEKQIFRIDHYLGKELVQNILVFRFANNIFEKVWNKEHVDHVQIIVSEKIGVGARGNYYDDYGAIKDMIQNHLLQLLCMVSMEEPKTMNAKDIRDEKVKILKKIYTKNIITGTYAKGIIDGENVIPYTEEKGVKEDSTTETFAFVETYVNDPRWQDVPFYMMTGKRLRTSYAEINLVLKDSASRLFNQEEPNIINIRIQPDEGIAVKFNSKHPGTMRLTPALLEFCHACEFGLATPEAYEKLIYESLLGDQTLFTRFDEVEESWKFIQQIMMALNDKKPVLYAAGVDYPKEVEEYLKKKNRKIVPLRRKFIV